MFDLTGRVVLVTGATQGIGQGIAEVFARAGAQVVVAGRHAGRGQAVVAAIRAEGGQAHWQPADLSSASGVADLMHDVQAQVGEVTVLVHNAGVFPMATIEALTDAQLDETLAVNLKAAFWLTRAVVPAMRRRRWGRLLFTSSVTGPRVAMPMLAHYAASKAGLNGFVRAASLEYARDGITVNAVEPGYIHTQAMDQLGDANAAAQMAAGIPMGRLGHPHDIGHAMLYLASEEASYVTGQSLAVDGGSCTPESEVQLQAYYRERLGQ